MKSRQLACLAVSTVAIFINGTARGTTISQYAFTGNTLNATTVDPNVTAGSITGSPNVNNQATSTLIFVTGVGYASQPSLGVQRANTNEAGTRSNVYFTFTTSPNAGYELDFSSLTFNIARGGASTPRDYDIRSSLDGFASSLSGGIVTINTARPTFTPVSIDLSAPQFQHVTSPITFQMLYFTPTVAQSIDIDDITLNGSVVPEPNSIVSVLTILGAWMIRRRCRGV